MKAALLRRLLPTIANHNNYQPSRVRLSLVVGLPHWEIWYDFWPRPAYRAMPEAASKPCSAVGQAPKSWSPLALVGLGDGSQPTARLGATPSPLPPRRPLAHAPPSASKHILALVRETRCAYRQTLKSDMPFCPFCRASPDCLAPPPLVPASYSPQFRPAHSCLARLCVRPRERRSSPQSFDSTRASNKLTQGQSLVYQVQSRPAHGQEILAGSSRLPVAGHG